jgi:hypothetical protein
MPSTGDSERERAWLLRVLGLDPSSGSPSGAAAGAPRVGKALPVWIAAREQVGEQITKLQDAMRGTKYPLLEKLADRGLNGITGRLQVGLQVQLMELDQSDAAGRSQAAGKVRTGIADFRAFLQTDRIVPLIEKNPFGVPVTLSASLGEALAAIEQILPG